MFVLTSVALCSILVFDVLCLSYLSEEGVGFWGSVWFVGFWALLAFLIHFFLGIDVLDILTQNWQFVLLGLAGYVGVGLSWTFVKWWRYASRARKNLVVWLVQNPIHGAIEPSLYYDRVPSPAKYDGKTGKFTLQASRHKGRIIQWMILWPFSMLGTLINDLVFRMWEALYEMFSGFYQKISDLVFADVSVGK